MKDTINTIDKLIENHQMQITELMDLKKQITNADKHDLAPTLAMSFMCQKIGRAKRPEIANEIQFTAADIDAFRTEVRWAIENNINEFTFKGHKLATDYAKHLLQYMEGK